MKNILKCSMIIIGTLIGAGFASGQEIASFFNRFLDLGLVGLLTASLLFGIIIYGVMKIIYKYDIEKYEDLIKNNKLALAIMKVFTFICFCIMISAVGSYGEQEYNISFWWGAVFASLVCFVSFLFKFYGLEKINNVLVPLILIGVLIIGFNQYDVSAKITMYENIKEVGFIKNWFLSALLYAGYNSILLVPILVELRVYRLNNKDILSLSLIVLLLLGLSGILIHNAISLYFPEILTLELPALFLAGLCGNFARYYYGVIILFAIFTTAFSCGFAFLRMHSDRNYFKNAFFICVTGIILSRIGFSDMINFFFPIFGYLGILQIFIIFFSKRMEGKKVE